MTADKDARGAELTHQRTVLVAAMAAELVRQRKLAALWKRLHWADAEGGCLALEEMRARRDASDACYDSLAALGEDPRHTAGDPGGAESAPRVRMAYAPQAGEGAEVV